MKKKASLAQALLPIIILISLLGTNVLIFGANSTEGPNQTAMLLAAAFGTIIAIRLGYAWEEVQKSIVKSISAAMGAILILMIIGALSGTWLLSGIVPAMIYYGLKILNPTYFLVAACLVSAIVTLATGSSWSTVATVGIALLGIGRALGLPEPIIAGAIISGSYFGDKMSPLSDTTNMAPAMAGTDLFTHVRYMMYTTIPTIILALVIFLGWGYYLDVQSTHADSTAVLSAIEASFNLSPMLFLVPGVVFFMIIKKVPALPALLIGSLLGGAFAVAMQPEAIRQVSGAVMQNIGYPAGSEGSEIGYVKASFLAVVQAMGGSIHIKTQHSMVNELLSTSGMFGMMNTIWLITCAMVFGGVMESCGLLKVIANHIIQWAHSTGSLVASTAATCIFFNLTASDQYMAIAVPGRMFAETYRRRGYKPEVLSRTLEDSGTVTSVLIPWNTCGATQAKVLGVSTLSYAPFCYFCILSPLMTVLHAYMDIKIRKIHGRK